MAETPLRRRLLGLVVAVAVLALVAATLDLDEVAATLAEASGGWLLVTTVAYLPSWLLRGWRWQGLARDLGDEVPLGPAAAFATVGNMLNLVLPAKAGDLLWTHAAHERFGVPYGRGLVGVLAGRVLDLVVLLALGTLALATSGSELASAAWASLAALSVAGVAGWLVVVRWRLGGRVLVGPLARLLPIHDALVEPAAQLGARPGRVLIHLASTCLIWAIEGFVAWSIARSLAVALGPGEVLIAIMVANLSKIVPLTPASFGTYEAAGALALQTLGVAYSAAFAVLLVEHLLKNLVNTGLGVVAMALTDVPVLKVDLDALRERARLGAPDRN